MTIEVGVVSYVGGGVRDGTSRVLSVVHSVSPLSLLASSSTSVSGLDPTSNSTSALDSKGAPVHIHNHKIKAKGSQPVDAPWYLITDHTDE